MKHKDFKIIVEGEELNYPMLRLATFCVAVYIVGYIGGALIGLAGL